MHCRPQRSSSSPAEGMERGRALWPLTGQGRRYFPGPDDEGTVRYHANDHPLGANLSTRYQDHGFDGDTRGHTIDYDRSPHSDRVLSFLTAMPRDQQHGLQRTGFTGTRSGLPQHQFDHMWGIGSPGQEHDLFGVEPLPEDAIIMVGGRPLRADQRAELDDLGGPSFSTPIIYIGSNDHRVPDVPVRELLEVVRQVSTHDVRETASLEAYEAALLDLIAPASGTDHTHWYFTDWHRYPPHFQYFIGTSCHGAAPRAGFRYIRRISDIQYPVGHLRADGGTVAGHLVVHPRLATALALTQDPSPRHGHVSQVSTEDSAADRLARSHAPQANQLISWTTFIDAMLDHPLGIDVGADVQGAYAHASAFPSVMRLLREQAIAALALRASRSTVIFSGMLALFEDELHGRDIIHEPQLRQQGGRAGRDGWRTARQMLRVDYIDTPSMSGIDRRPRIITDSGYDTFLRSSTLNDHGLIREVLTTVPSPEGSSTVAEAMVRRTTHALRSIYVDRPHLPPRSVANSYDGILQRVFDESTPHQPLDLSGRVDDDPEDPRWRARQRLNNAPSLETPSHDERSYRLTRVGLRPGDENSLVGDGPTDDEEVDSDVLEELLADSDDSTSASSYSTDPRQEFIEELRRMWFEHGRARPRLQVPNFALRDLDEHFMQDLTNMFNPDFITHFPVLVDDSMLDDARMTRQCNARALNAMQWEAVRHLE